MPTYAYRCGEGHTFDAFQKITDRPLVQCRRCGAPCQRVIQPVPAILKGGGWAREGYAKK